MALLGVQLMATLGIDPGMEGAAVLLDDAGGFTGCWHWTRARMKASDDTVQRGWDLGSCMAVVAGVAHGFGALACIESMYVPKDPKRHPSFLVLMEATGIAIGACQAAGLQVPYRPKATQWRKKICPKANGRTRAIAERIELGGIGLLLDIPEPWNRNIHVVEAAMIALYGHHKALHGPKPPKWTQ